MHHIVGAHASPGGSGNALAVWRCGLPRSRAAAAPGAVVVLARGAQPDSEGGLLHPCLVVLAGLGLLAGLLLTWWFTPAPDPAHPAWAWVREPAGNGPTDAAAAGLNSVSFRPAGWLRLLRLDSPSLKPNPDPALPAAAHRRPHHLRPTQTQNPHPGHLTPGTATS